MDKPEELIDEEIEKITLLQSVILSFDILRAAEIEADGNDTAVKLDAAFAKLKSTEEGRAWLRERARQFRPASGGDTNGEI